MFFEYLPYLCRLAEVYSLDDLIISQAGPQDAGDYECRAVSAAGIASGSATARMAGNICFTAS